MIGVESEERRLQQQDLAYETFCFFGVPFRVGFDSPVAAEFHRTTYKHLTDRSANLRDPILTFNVLSENAEKAVVVEHANVSHLVEVFRRGSNRHRFRIGDSESGEPDFYQITDAFLRYKPVMVVGERTCFFLDNERWHAYAESVIFHTVLSHIPDHLLLHAGVVSTNGRAVILCGDANKGKTTLTLALVGEGFRFLSDEVAFIDRKNRLVHPFPRALGLRDKTVGMFSKMVGGRKLHPTRSLSGDEKWLVDIDEIFPGSRGSAASIAAMIFMDGFSKSTTLDTMTTADALLECNRFCHTAEENPFQAMLAVADVVESAKCYRLQSGNLQETVRIVANCLNND